MVRSTLVGTKNLYIQRHQHGSTFGRFPYDHRLGSFALSVILDNADPTITESATDTTASTVDPMKARTHTSSASSDGLVGSLKPNLKRTGPNQNTLTRGNYRLARSGRRLILVDLKVRLRSGVQRRWRGRG